MDHLTTFSCTEKKISASVWQIWFGGVFTLVILDNAPSIVRAGQKTCWKFVNADMWWWQHALWGFSDWGTWHLNGGGRWDLWDESSNTHILNQNIGIRSKRNMSQTLNYPIFTVTLSKKDCPCTPIFPLLQASLFIQLSAIFFKLSRESKERT